MVRSPVGLTVRVSSWTRAPGVLALKPLGRRSAWRRAGPRWRAELAAAELAADVRYGLDDAARDQRLEDAAGRAVGDGVALSAQQRQELGLAPHREVAAQALERAHTMAVGQRGSRRLLGARERGTGCLAER